MLHNARLLLLLASLTKLLLQPIPIQPLSKVLHSPLKPSLAGVQPLQERSCLTYCSFLPPFLHAPYLHINGTRSPWSCFCLSATTFVRIALLLILSHIGYFVPEVVPSKSCLERGRVRRDSLNTGFLQAKDLRFYFFILSSVCFGLVKQNLIAHTKILLGTLIILTWFHLHFFSYQESVDFCQSRIISSLTIPMFLVWQCPLAKMAAKFLIKSNGLANFSTSAGPILWRGDLSLMRAPCK